MTDKRKCLKLYWHEDNNSNLHSWDREDKALPSGSLQSISGVTYLMIHNGLQIIEFTAVTCDFVSCLIFYRDVKRIQTVERDKFFRHVFGIANSLKSLLNFHSATLKLCSGVPRHLAFLITTHNNFTSEFINKHFKYFNLNRLSINCLLLSGLQRGEEDTSNMQLYFLPRLCIAYTTCKLSCL